MQTYKSICLKGNILNGPLSYRPYPVTEFSSGKWSLAVSSISYESSAVLSFTCAITSNFSTSVKRTSKNEIKVYEMPLAVFHLKTATTAPRSVFRFSPIYHPMNSIGDELRISFVDIFEDNDVPLKLNCHVVVQLLFEKN
jgi:hypothetical protein